MSSDRVFFDRRTFPRRAVLAMALLIGTSGCSSMTQSRNPFDGSPARGNVAEDPISIEIQNLNFNDVTVWALRQGQRIRVGRVTGKTDQTFRIQWNLGLPISFSIDLIGGRSCTTTEIGLDRNATVWVSIPLSVSSQPCRAGRR